MTEINEVVKSSDVLFFVPILTQDMLKGVCFVLFPTFLWSLGRKFCLGFSGGLSGKLLACCPSQPDRVVYSTGGTGSLFHRFSPVFLLSNH